MTKIHSTTQNFTEIVDIVDNIIFFKNGSASTILEITSVNFYLLSKDEQDAKIFSYMALLNSLSFYIQILTVSKKIDLSFYLQIIDQKIAQEKNQRILEQLKLYKDFVQQLMRGEDLLDKKIYVVIPFSQLELGPIAQTKNISKGNVDASYLQRVRDTLSSKKNELITQFQRIGLYARGLKTEELGRLLYEAFNEDPINLEYQENDMKNIII